MSAWVWGIEFGLCFIQNALYLKLICNLYRIRKNAQILTAAAVCAGISLMQSLQGMKLPDMMVMGLILCMCGWILVKEEAFAIASITFFYIVYLNGYECLITLLMSGPGAENLIARTGMDEQARILFITGIRGPEILILILLRIFICRINIVKNKMLKMFFAALAGEIAFSMIMHWSRVSVHYFSTVKFLILWLGVMALVFIFLMFDLALSGKKYRIENERMKRQLLEEKYQSLNEIYSKNAKLYHDLNNHLNLLWQLLNEGKIEEAKTYISNISEPVRHMQKVTWTGVDLVDVVLNSKIEVMQEKNIAYQVNVELPQNTGISEADICTILSNLLDNAIEAVEKLPRQETPVRVTMRSIRKMLFIQISNPCIGIEIPEGGLPETSKKEKERHGWGLWNVADLAEKYQGTFQVESEKGIFKAVVMLFFLQ